MILNGRGTIAQSGTAPALDPNWVVRAQLTGRVAKAKSLQFMATGGGGAEQQLHSLGDGGSYL